MNYRLARLIAVITTSTLIVAACSGTSSTSTRTRNTVMAAQPCITVTPFDRQTDPQSEDVINFCPGAMSYSLDGGVTKLPVPTSRSVEIPEENLPEEINNVRTLNVISYDGADVAINDDLVQVIQNTGCADGYACEQGETGPFGGAVLIADKEYFEVMPIAGTIFEDVPMSYLNSKDAVASAQLWSQANIDNSFSGFGKWHMPHRGEFDQILKIRLENNLSIPRFTSVAMSPQQNASWCDRNNESTCTYENYWVEQGSEKCQSEDSPLAVTLQEQEESTAVQDVTVGFPVCDPSLVPTLATQKIGLCSLLNGTEATAACKARLVPIRSYQPNQSRVVEVSQYDSDNWQYKCLGKPAVSISKKRANEEMTVNVSSPCLAQASEDRPVNVYIDLQQMEDDGTWTSVRSTTAPLQGDVGGSDDNMVGVAAPTKTVSKTFIPQEMKHHVVVYISFPEVGKITRSETFFSSIDVQSRQVQECTREKLVLVGDELTASCGGTSLSLSIGGKIQNENTIENVKRYTPQDQSKPNTVKITDGIEGWRLYQAVVAFANGRPAVKMGALCIAVCGNTDSDGLRIEPIDEKSVVVKTQSVDCAPNLMWLLPMDGVPKNTNLLDENTIQEKTPLKLIDVETVLDRPASDMFFYVTVDCGFAATTTMGVRFVEGSDASSENSKPAPDVVAQTKVADFLDTNVPLVNLAAKDSVITFSASDLATVTISTNGVTATYSPKDGTVTVPVAKDAQVLDITTVGTNGEITSFTKAISRPSQLPSSESVAVTAETSSNNQVPLLVGLLVLLIICGFAIMKIRTSKKSS